MRMGKVLNMHTTVEGKPEGKKSRGRYRWR